MGVEEGFNVGWSWKLVSLIRTMIKWAFGGLGSRIYAMADRTTLHNDDRVMSVFSRHCC